MRLVVVCNFSIADSKPLGPIRRENFLRNGLVSDCWSWNWLSDNPFKRDRNAMLNDGTRTAGVGTVSINRIDERISAFFIGSSGVNDWPFANSLNTSSVYSQMTLESLMIFSSCTRVGTTPLSFFLRCSGRQVFIICKINMYVDPV